MASRAMAIWWVGALATLASSSVSTFNLKINTTKATFETMGSSFVSFNIDAADLSTDFDWASPRLAALASELGPGFLRIGGGAQKDVAYDDAFFEGPWQGVVTLAANLAPAGIGIIWGMNPDFTQAAALLAREDIVPTVAQWEWGNEPHTDEDESQAVALANDFVAFRAALVARLGPENVVLAGPDVGFGTWHSCPDPGTADERWLEAFFAVANGTVLDAATIHVYPFDHDDVGGDAQPGDPVCADEAAPAGLPWCNFTRVLWGPELYDARPPAAFTGPFARAARAHGVRDLRMGETAVVNHGGWDNVSNAFASGFWYVDALGRLARDGFSAVQRQSLASARAAPGGEEFGNYALLSDSPAFDPNPDYFTAVLWGRLMGAKVLQANYSFEVAEGPPLSRSAPFPTPPGLNQTIRVWAHCTAGGVEGSVTVSFANPQTFAVRLALPASIPASNRAEYVLTVPAGDEAGAQSKFVSLNGGAPLTVGSDNLLPPLEPRIVENGSNGVLVPRLSYGFFVLGEAGAEACN